MKTQRVVLLICAPLVAAVAAHMACGGTHDWPVDSSEAGGDAGADRHESAAMPDSPAEADEPNALDALGEDGDDVAPAATPIWKPLPNATCWVEYLSNPLDVGPAFTWKSCDNPALPDCSALELAPFLTVKNGSIYPPTQAYDDGTTTWLAFTIWGGPSTEYVAEAYSVIAREDGVIVAAYHTSGDYLCSFACPTIGQGRFESRMATGPKMNDAGVWTEQSALGPLALDASTVLAGPFAMPGGSLPQLGAIMNGLVVWTWEPFTMLSSMSAIDGSGFQSFATSFDAGGAFGWPYAVPGLFLFEEQSKATRIMASDGKSAPFDYLVPGVNEALCIPRSLKSHVAWLKGIGVQEFNVYDSMELWASPHATDPSKLVPSRVAAIPFQYCADWAAAGWDYFAIAGRPDPTPPNPSLHLWRVPDGLHRHLVLPGGFSIGDVSGFGPEDLYLPIHIWPSGYKEYFTIYKIKLSSIPVE